MTDKYWVGGSQTWDATAGTKWSLSSGGASGAAVPGAADRAIFDGASGAAVVTVSTERFIGALLCTGFTGTLTGGASTALAINGACTLAAGMTLSGSISFRVNGSLTSAGKALYALSVSSDVFFSSITTSLADNLTVGSIVSVPSSGTSVFTANNKNVTVTTAVAIGGGAVTTTFTLGSGVWTLSGAGAIWDTSGTNVSLTVGAATFVISDATATTKTFKDTGRAYTTNQFTLSGSGVFAFDLDSGSLTLSAGLSVPGFSFVSGTLTFAGFTLTLTGTGTVWHAGSTGVTLSVASSTIKLTNASSSSKTFDGGSRIYGTLWLSGAGTGTFIVTGSNEYAAFTLDTPPHTVQFESGSTQTITTLSIDGTAGNLMTLEPVGAAHWNIVSGAGVSASYLALRGSHAHGGAFTAANSFDAGDNFNWDFTRSSATDIYFDSAYQYNGSATATLTGLNWLIGETLGVVADGVDIGDAVVSSAGNLTLPSSATGSIITVGKRYLSRAVTLRAPQTGNQDGASLGRQMNIKNAAADILDTPYLKVGTLTGTEIIPPSWRGGVTGDGGTGLYEIPIDDSYFNEGVIVFESDKGYPAVVRAVRFSIESEP